MDIKKFWVDSRYILLTEHIVAVIELDFQVCKLIYFDFLFNAAHNSLINSY